MNRLLENGQLQELTCGTNFAYILSEKSLFSPTEYKVLQGQSNGGLIRCMKMMYNGHVQLYYMVNGLKSLSSMLPNLDADSFLAVMTNLFEGVIETKNNGFLSCQNIEMPFDKIFIDSSTLKVKLVYLPLSVHLFEDDASYESLLRSNLVKLINSSPAFSSARTMRLASDLSNGKLSLEDLHSRIKGGAVSGGGMQSNSAGSPKPVSSRLRIIAMNAPTRVEIEVSKDSFILGKNAAVVDGVISFNKMISRVHCRIDKNGNQYTITDLQSANGTYVNRVRLQPNQPHPIKNGDIVKLANSDFQVVLTKKGAV